MFLALVVGDLEIDTRGAGGHIERHRMVGLLRPVVAGECKVDRDGHDPLPRLSRQDYAARGRATRTSPRALCRTSHAPVTDAILGLQLAHEPRQQIAAPPHREVRAPLSVVEVE